MTVIKLDIHIEQHATFDLPQQIFTIAGTPVDLVVDSDNPAYEAHMHIRRTPGSATLLLEATRVSGEITLGHAGEIDVKLSAEDTGELPAGRWSYDLVLVHVQSGQRYRALEGVAVVSAGATQL